MDLEEKIINQKLIYKGSFLEIINVDVNLPDGSNTSRDIVKHPGATAIIAFLDEENIILVEQFRLPLNRVMLEIPAGKLNKNEEIIECARRELQEETGYRAKNMEYLGCIATAPGFCDEIIYLYKATDLTLGDKCEDEDEFTNVKILNINTVKEMIKKGEIIDGKTISMFSYL
ncbi:NUDIX hydrolase [Clostridium sp. AL.422]|uniref:NUDIX hydrolase n=1 Tax=Clostridium TaxID=1485 RepID=UPI00293DB387|nr:MULTISPECIES: NUDIX hydrolase [unclassified Clostridium]MDV4152151.1 NUDIX hydrolase [Clostridium sp. AL.422]